MTGRTLQATCELDRSACTQRAPQASGDRRRRHRGVLSLMVLAKIESMLIEESKTPYYRLADYFDYVAGTSTGGIIAAGIAMECRLRRNSRLLCRQRRQDVRQGEPAQASPDPIQERAACAAAKKGIWRKKRLSAPRRSNRCCS